MSEVRGEKRDLVLPPGCYAYMQDVTKGQIKTHTGPTVINMTAQDRPVVYDPQAGRFMAVQEIEAAVKQSPLADEGDYVVLRNPAVKGDYPNAGSAQPSADLDIGRMVNIPGPISFALWPGQAAEVLRGHHLRSNQYLLARVYNEEAARKNWSQAVVKPAGVEPGAEPGVESGRRTALEMPKDLTVGKLFIIRGTEASFFIPPTGISVVKDNNEYVREALTLERLEYCILIDENGRKRYEKGPQVVFPEPTERFFETKDERGQLSRKFRAIELNEIQGIHIKVIADYAEGEKKYKAGDELFVTGKETQIYFPREEHSAVKYDGKAKHFATAVPAGEARYVMDRIKGHIRTVKGPAMLLPDPRTEVIVRRVLSDKQVSLWYPGNGEALAYNQALREILTSAPTTRAGAISEGDFTRGVKRGIKQEEKSGGSVMYAAVAASNAAMESSRVSGDQGLAGDEFSRASSYTAPRTVTLDTKYQGVPSTDIWTGYAALIVSKTGRRRVEVGPTTVLLDYDESLEVLELSTGKPKTTDNLYKTVFLRVANNKVADLISVETSDHVQVEIRVSLRVNFEAQNETDRARWFDVENYVKLLTDHVRSVLKGAIKKVKVEDFYANSVDIVRDIILGKAVEGGHRPGMLFVENAMHVTDVEVLHVKIGDERIRTLLDAAQHDVVKTNIEMSTLRRNVATTSEKEALTRQEQAVRAETAKAKHGLEIELAASELALILTKSANALKINAEKLQLVGEEQKLQDVSFDAQLARQRRSQVQDVEFLIEEQERHLKSLQAETAAVAARFTAAQGGFSEALTALSNNETLQKVAEAWSIQRIIGGASVSDALARVFENTPLSGTVAKLTNGNGAAKGVTAPVTQ